MHAASVGRRSGRARRVSEAVDEQSVFKALGRCSAAIGSVSRRSRGEDRPSARTSLGSLGRSATLDLLDDSAEPSPARGGHRHTRAVSRRGSCDLSAVAHALTPVVAPVRMVSRGTKLALKPITGLNKGAFYLITHWDVEATYMAHVKAGSLNWRTRLYRFLGSPASTSASRCYSQFLGLVSIASIIILGIEMSLEAEEVRNGLLGGTDGAFSCGLNSTLSWAAHFRTGHTAAWTADTHRCFTFYIVT